MNCKLWNKIGCLLVIAMISLSITLTVMHVGAFHPQPSAYSVTVEKTSPIAKQAQSGLSETQIPFDISRFTNGSHKILVNRTTGVRVYGFAIDNVTIHIYNNDTMFNTFDISVPSAESASLHYYDFKDLGNPEPEFKPEIIEIQDGVDFKTFTLQVADIEPNSWRNISMIAGYSDRIQPNWNPPYYDYNYSIPFCPLISMPITNYTYTTWLSDPGIATGETLILDTLQPDIAFSLTNLTTELGEIYRLLFDDVNALPTVNLTLLDQYGYQEGLEENITFIPGFQPGLAQNLSIPLTFNFSLDVPPMEYSKFVRRLEIDQWGSVQVYETITMTNLGYKSGTGPAYEVYGTTNRFRTYVPDEITFESCSDYYGNMTVTTRQTLKYFASTDSSINVTELLIAPRIVVSSNESYTFTLSYRLPLVSVLNTTEEGTLMLSMWLSSGINWTVRDFTLEIVLPMGSVSSSDSLNILRDLGLANVTSSVGTPGFLNLGNSMVITARMFNITEFHNSYFHITYDAGILWAVWTPFTISLAMFVLGLAYLGVRSVTFSIRGVSGAGVEEIPVEAITNFIKTYEEKTALQKRIDDLDRRYARGKIKKRKYTDDRKILETERTKVERQVVIHSTNLKRRGYDTFMRIIENSETERGDLKANLSRLRQRYSKGTISKEQYERQSRQYQKRLQDAKNRIDKALIELRSKLEQAKAK